jgi:hypothetical protein
MATFWHPTGSRGAAHGVADPHQATGHVAAGEGLLGHAGNRSWSLCPTAAARAAAADGVTSVEVPIPHASCQTRPLSMVVGIILIRYR